MVQRTFYALASEAPPEQASWEPAPHDEHTLTWGYNLADLDRLSWVAARRTFGGGTDFADNHDIAWGTIVETLYTADQPPEPYDLLRVASGAIITHRRVEARQHGISVKTWETRPGFEQYWDRHSLVTASHENHVIDRVALWQIWPKLTDRQREAILALAATGNYDQAAAAVGLTPDNFSGVLTRARRAFLHAWHQGEQPSTIWRPRRRPKQPVGRNGKTRVTTAQFDEIRSLLHQSVPRAEIATRYGLSKSALARLIRGQTLPYNGEALL